MSKGEKENFEYNDEYCGECGCGVDCDDPNHHDLEDLEFHNVDEDIVMNLVLEDDTELECLVLGIFQIDEENDDEYVALLPLDEEKAESGVLLYKYIEMDEEEFELESIEEDDEFEKVSGVFFELFSEQELNEHVSHYHEHGDKFVAHENYDELDD